jgi:hypothetical protein
LPLNTACVKTQSELFLGGLATSTSVIVLLSLDSYPANRYRVDHRARAPSDMPR